MSELKLRPPVPSTLSADSGVVPSHYPTKLRGLAFDFVAMFGIDAKHSEGGRKNRGPGDQSEQAEHFETAENTDKKQQIIELGAMPQQQRTNQIVREPGDASTNGDDQDGLPPVAVHSQPQRRGRPNQR